MRKLICLLCMAFSFNLVSAGRAATVVDIDASAVTWTTEADHAVLRITGPEGFVLARELGSNTAFSLVPIDAGKILADGLYRWNLVASPSGLFGESPPTAERSSGYFTITGGTFVTRYDEKVAADKDDVINDDLIVQGSICAGDSCADNEEFGDDIIRMKDFNVRLSCLDQSTQTGFPTNDWQLTCNDSTSGGADRFSIEDLDGGLTPFTVEAGAPDHSIYIDPQGDVGLGTNTPLAGLHLTRNDGTAQLLVEETSTTEGTRNLIRIENNGTARIAMEDTSADGEEWQVAINGGADALILTSLGSGATEFVLVRADTGAANAGDLTIVGDIFTTGANHSGDVDITGDVGISGDVGIGPGTPSAPLHVRQTDGTAEVLVEEASSTETFRDLIQIKNNGTTGISMEDTSVDGEEWQLRVNGAADAFVINAQGSGTTEFSMNRGDASFNPGRLTISGSIVTGGSTCGGGCDAVFQGDIESMEEQAEYMWEHSHLPSIGPTSPNEPWNLTEKTGAILTELEKAHIYIDQLNQTIRALEQTVGEHRDLNEELMERLERLEAAQGE